MRDDEKRHETTTGDERATAQSPQDPTPVENGTYAGDPAQDAERERLADAERKHRENTEQD